MELNGVTITAKQAMTADELAQAFATVFTNTDPTTTSTANYAVSGSETKTGSLGDADASATGAVLTLTAAENGVGSDPSITATGSDAKAVAEATAATGKSTGGYTDGILNGAEAVSAQQASDTITLTDLAAGQSYEIAGITLTALKAVTAPDLVTAFVGQLKASDATDPSTSDALVVSGTYANPTGWSGNLTWSAGTEANANQLILKADTAGNAIDPTEKVAGTIAKATEATVTFTDGDGSSNEATATIAFTGGLTLGQSQTFNGVTITAKGNMTAENVTDAFLAILNGDAATTATYIGTKVEATLPEERGTATFGKDAESKALTVTAETTDKLIDPGITVTGNTEIAVAALADVEAVETVPGALGQQEVNTIVFTDPLLLGQSYTLAGLTLTSLVGDTGLSVSEISSAFANALSGKGAGAVVEDPEVGYVIRGTVDLGSTNAWTNPIWNGTTTPGTLTVTDQNANGGADVDNFTVTASAVSTVGLPTVTGDEAFVPEA